jgi:NAD-reducing hydrogenase large subunit
MAYHWARMIEVLHAMEKIQELLNDPDLQGTDLVTKGERRLETVSACSRRRAARCSTTTRSTSTTR